MDFIIVESFSHHIPTGLGFIEGLTQLGHNAYALPTTQYNINQINQELDVVILLGWPNVKDVVEFKQSHPLTKIIVVGFGWNDIVLELKDYIAVWMEHTYKHELADKVFKQHGLTLHHIPLGASSERFKPLNIEKQYDLSFIGQFGRQGHGYRHEDVYLYPLIKRQLNGFYSGFDGHPSIRHTQINEIYNSTKINVNFHYPYQKQESENMAESIDFNGRVFEIALAGGFQLCDHPYIRDYFGEGIVTATHSHWEEVFDYYINNPTLRVELAHQAQQTALANHTWKSRMQQLISIL